MSGMVDVLYTPASAADGWLLVRSGTCSLLCPRDIAAEDVDSLWNAVRAVDPVRASLDVLARNGLTTTPAFALVDWTGAASDRAIVIVRGTASVTVVEATVTTTVDATSVSTWRETSFVGVQSIRLGEAVPGGFALEAGVVRATGATLTVSQEPPIDTPMSRVSTAPVTAPVPIDAVATTVMPAPTVIENTIAEPAESLDGGYAHLFEETVVRSVEEAAVRPPDESDEVEPGKAGDLDGDHDGLTIMSGDLAKLRAAGKSTATTPSEAPTALEARELHLELSTGDRESLAQPVLIGRSPSATRVSSGQVPRLVTITGDQDISRNHAEFTLQGGTAVVTDLHSRNGTTVIMPGKPPQRLRAGEPTPVLVDTVVDLGGGITVTVRES